MLCNKCLGTMQLEPDALSDRTPCMECNFVDWLEVACKKFFFWGGGVGWGWWIPLTE